MNTPIETMIEDMQHLITMRKCSADPKVEAAWRERCDIFVPIIISKFREISRDYEDEKYNKTNSKAG